VSYFVPLLDDLDLQSNLALSIGIIPFAWLGASIYYRKDTQTHGIKVGALMVLTAIILDGLFTVPFIVIPYGGSYVSFYTAPAFWIIALEYLLVVIVYWRLKVNLSFIY